jgi:adenylate cyclase
MSVARKLTTILCADVEGYTRLMERDEHATLDLLKRHRGAMSALIQRHHGRVVNTWGDALLADFPSVVEAVQCAVETQRELRARNETLAADSRLAFRIGINLGDVMVDGDDIYGEGVNVAARLQSLAEPGGIIISDTVHAQVRGKLSVGYDFVGPQKVKNVAEPVPAFRVTLDGSPGRPPPAPIAASASRLSPRHRRLLTHSLLYVGFLAAINLFTMADGHGRLWVHWPALAIAFVTALLWTRRDRSRG